MKTFARKLGASWILIIAAGWSAHSAADIVLFETALNIDGTPTSGDFSGLLGVDDTGFDYGMGLGSLSITLTGVGAHYVSLFVDHEMSEAENTFFNENGEVDGALAAGQTYEIDEPGYLFGDIYTNFLASLLDNSNAFAGGLQDDVSMALGWDFILAVDEIASIDFLLSTVMPGSGFFLTHSDPDSQEVVYFSSSLSVSSVSVPEPATTLLLGAGLLALGIGRRRRALRSVG